MRKLIVCFLILSACTQTEEGKVKLQTTVYKADTEITGTDTTYHIETDSNYLEPAPGQLVNTGSTDPQQLVAFAQTLTDVPYKYGSTDPSKGFDCSGFVTYVFNHFGIEVPRSSVDFDKASARTVQLNEAKPGDLILFTGTDSTKKVVGHMGIIISKPHEPLTFIHSTSGKADGVTETPLNVYYQGRFMRAIRVFEQNDQL